MSGSATSAPDSEPAARLARRREPAFAGVEGNAHALLRPEPVQKEWAEGRRRFLQPHETLLRDHAGLEEMERASRHFWAHAIAATRPQPSVIS